MKWKTELLRAAQEVMLKGWRLEFIVYKDGNKRKAVINKIPPKEKIECEEETIIE